MQPPRDHAFVKTAKPTAAAAAAAAAAPSTAPGRQPNPGFVRTLDVKRSAQRVARAPDHASAIAVEVGLAAETSVADIAGLFRQHHAELVRLAALILGDLPAGEDAVQDVFTRLSAGRPRLADGVGSLSYLRAAVLNECRSAHRRRGMMRRRGRLHDMLIRDSPLDSAESEVIVAEERRRVLRALARLPRRRREVLVLRYYLQLPEAEIAAVLGISPGTVKSTAARGLAALARTLGEKA